MHSELEDTYSTGGLMSSVFVSKKRSTSSLWEICGGSRTSACRGTQRQWEVREVITYSQKSVCYSVGLHAPLFFKPNNGPYDRPTDPTRLVWLTLFSTSGHSRRLMAWLHSAPPFFSQRINLWLKKTPGQSIYWFLHFNCLLYLYLFIFHFTLFAYLLKKIWNTPGLPHVVHAWLHL